MKQTFEQLVAAFTKLPRSDLLMINLAVTETLRRANVARAEEQAERRNILLEQQAERQAEMATLRRQRNERAEESRLLKIAEQQRHDAELARRRVSDRRRINYYALAFPTEPRMTPTTEKFLTRKLDTPWPQREWDEARYDD